MSVNFINVQNVLDNYKSSVYEKDVERFLTIYAPDIHIYDCWSNWECKGISHWRTNVEEWFNELRGDGVSLIVDFNDVVIEENVDLAFVHCSVNFTAKNVESGEKLRQLTNRFTFGLRKVNGSWMITHEHSSLPINKDTGKGIFNLK